MNPQDPLGQLHPLRDPELIGWWPMAPGWWILIALCLLAILVLACYFLKRYRANAYRRQALRQLHTIADTFSGSKGDRDAQRPCISDTNALLKSVALRVFSRHDVASLSGEAWLGFLNETRCDLSPETEFFPSFATAAYRRELPELDTERLFSASRNWITKHRAPS